MDPSATTYPPDRSPADTFVRRVLRVPPSASDGDTARSAFGASLLLSTVRCMLTYVVLPLLKPVVDLSGNVGPALGLVIAAVSALAIVFSMRRFWKADHRLRWAYTVFGSVILVLLAFGAVQDVAALT